MQFSCFILILIPIGFKCSYGFRSIQLHRITPGAPAKFDVRKRVLPRQYASLYDEPGSPSKVFGTPIDEELKETNRKLVRSLKSFLFDRLYQGESIDRDYARFYALETIARMPYFSYLSCLHLYETLGLWRNAEYLKTHFAESWNELHHLLIMEHLGGNEKFIDRFVAQHIAFFYYWIVVILYMTNPNIAYNLNEAVENEAYETYDKFLGKHTAVLKKIPAPEVAKEYYTGKDMYLFDVMNTSGKRRPKCKTLYDCFINIRDDELQHAKTMSSFQHND